MLRFGEYGILEERSRALAVRIARNNQHALQGADVTHGLARLRQIGPQLALFEMPFQVGIFDVRLTLGPEGERYLQDDESSTLAGIENTGAIAEPAGLRAQFPNLPVLKVEDLNR